MELAREICFTCIQHLTPIWCGNLICNTSILHGSPIIFRRNLCHEKRIAFFCSRNTRIEVSLRLCNSIEVRSLIVQYFLFLKSSICSSSTTRYYIGVVSKLTKRIDLNSVVLCPYDLSISLDTSTCTSTLDFWRNKSSCHAILTDLANTTFVPEIVRATCQCCHGQRCCQKLN